MEQKKATQVTQCKQCKKGLSATQKSLVVLSFYILISSIYGTIKLIQLLSDLF
jgi:hypothetical protein